MRYVLALFLFASQAWGQDAPLELKVEGGTLVKIDHYVNIPIDRVVITKFPTPIHATPNAGFYRWSYPATVKATDKGDTLLIDFAPKGDLKIDLKVESAVIVDGKIKYVTQFAAITVSVGIPEPVPPIPPIPPIPPVPPDPKPPVPVPVSSFHVIFVYESGKTYTPQQISAMDSKAVRDYLTANTTPEGNYAGFRKYDKDADSSKDTPTINAMWQATKPLVTAVPCVAIETNTKVEIVPLAATPTEMIAVFNKYLGK